MQSNTVRLFTPREANAMLPALRPLLMELASRHAEREQLEELLIEVEQDTKSRESMRDRIELEVRLDENLAELKQLFEALARHGVEVKDPAIGLIDFHAQRGAELVYLCYKLGETEVTHWHPLDDGYRGRKLLESEPDMLKI
ncbi:MAG: DUF2203 domain-containing protein [Candidatus Thermoplasmatota archaeon]|nr:DUF2203 domain-containing protein [Candidatus Thermoplasmatota archaeon]